MKKAKIICKVASVLVAFAALVLVSCGLDGSGNITINLPPIESRARAIAPERVTGLKNDTTSYRVSVEANGQREEKTGTTGSFMFKVQVGAIAEITLECLNDDGDVIVRAQKTIKVYAGVNNVDIKLSQDGDEIIPASSVSYSYGEANTGTTSGLPSDATYKEGDVFTVADGANMQWQHGTFSSWNASVAIEPEAGGQATNAPIVGQKYKMPKDGVTLTANWNKNTYTITYDMNAVATENTPSATSINQGSVQALEDYTIDGTTPQSVNVGSKNYTFTEWSDGNGNAYAVGEKISNVTENITLTAQWSDKDVWTVTYNKGSTQVNEQDITNWKASDNVVDGQSVTLPTLQATGYTFGGWQIDSETKQGGDNYTPTQSVTATAQWTADTYTLSYNYDGGSVNVEGATEFTIESLSLTFSTVNNKTGYTFSHWSVNNTDVTNYSGSQLLNLVTSGKTLTLTAVWNINSYQVTYALDGGSGGPASGNVQYNANVSLDAPTKAGYNFTGWSDGSTTYGGTSGNNSLTMPAGAITLTAQWTVKNYTVTFNTDGGTVNSITDFNVNYAGTFSNATKAGYSFQTWQIGSTDYTASTLKDAIVAGTVGSTSTTIELTAKWTPNTYNITYYDVDANSDSTAFSGTHGSNHPTQHTYGTETTLVDPTATKKGFVFGGWYTNSSGTGSPVGNALDATAYTNEIKLYAKWTIEMVTVTGGTQFTMGEAGGSDNAEWTGVTVSSFYMGKYEVTQNQWKAVMGSLPSTSSMASADGDAGNNPVNYVSWYDALVFCNKLSMLENKTPCYKINNDTNPDNWGTVPTSTDSTWDAVVCDWDADGYRLPTEAEWEYAARGGSNKSHSKYSGVNDATTPSPTEDDLKTVAWYSGNADSKTHEVGTTTVKENALGISDMSGNVYEMCRDWYSSSGYSSANGSTTSDPRGATTGSLHVVRGGGWIGSAIGCAVASRNSSNPYYRSNDYGLRLVSRLP